MKYFNYFVKISIAVCFFYFQYLSISAQDQSIADSLVKIYKKDKLENSSKLELLRNLSFNEMNNLELSLKYAEELIALAKSENNNLYLYRGYLQKGNKNWQLGNSEVSLDAFFKSAEAAIKATYIIGEGTAYMSIADVYSLKGNSDNAENYYNKAIQILRKADDSISLATALLNAGDEYYKNEKYDDALGYIGEAGNIFKNANHLNGTAYAKGNIGMVYAQQRKDELAKVNLNEAITTLEELQDFNPISEYLIHLSDIFLRQDNYTIALGHAKRSLKLATDYGLKDRISAANLQLSKLYEQSGNYRESHNYYKKHIAYRDSVTNITSVQQMANLRTNYEVSQKQAEVDLLEKESEIQQLKEKRQGYFNYAAIIALVLIFLFAAGMYNRYSFIKKTSRIIEDEKNRSEKLLLNILPEDTALELKEKGKVQAKKFESITVLFTDFKDFTHFSENLSPENLVRNVDYYFSKFDEIMGKYKLEKIKTIGDAYMCAGGMHSHAEDHPVKMVEAAIEILQIMKDAKTNITDNILPYEIRIGINTGPVVAGVVGTRKFAYDIWGDAVNIASRMESASEPDKINISENTYALIKDEFACEYRGEIAVKNRGMLKMYFVNKKKKIDKELLKNSLEV